MMFDLPSLRGIRPRRFGLVSWSGHVPFAFDLVAEFRPKLLVELGTHSGESFFAFCQAAQEQGTDTLCYAVDTWKGDPQAGFYDEDIFEDVTRHAQEFYPGGAYLVRATFDEAVAQFADESIDLLHIDGLHTYEAVKHDFETWLPKVSPGGIILFHDIVVRHGDFGAWRLWEELARADGGSFAFRHGWGLGVWQKTPGTPLTSAFLNKLFSCTEPEAETLRRYYGMAVEAVRLRSLDGEMSPFAPPPKPAPAPEPEAPPPPPDPYLQAQAETLRLQIYFPREDGTLSEEVSASLPLESDRWMTLETDLPAEWKGASLRIDPISGPGLAEIAAVRVVSRFFDHAAWECEGEALARTVRLGGSAKAVPSTRFLRLFSHGPDPQLYLPQIDLREFDEPLKLTITVRARLERQALAAELKTWTDQMDEWRVRAEREKETLAEAMKHLDLAAEERRKLDLSMIEARAAGQEASRRAERLQGELETARAAGRESAALLEAARTETETAHGQLAETFDRLAAAEKSLAGAKAAHGETQLHLEEAEAEALGTHTGLNGARIEADALRREIAALLDEIEAHEQAVRGQAGEIETLHAETQRLGAADADLRGARARLAAVEEELASIHECWKADQGRLDSMRRTASWRLTLPLRAAGRVFSSPPAKPVTFPTGPAPSAPPAKKTAPAAALETPPPARFRLQVDDPVKWRMEQRRGVIRGWCVPENEREEITGIRARVDGGREVQGRYGLPRPDVAREMGRDEDAQHCGFEIDVTLPPGGSTVQLEIIDGEGRAHPAGEYRARAPYTPLPAAVRSAAPLGDPADDYETWVALYDSFDAAARRRLRAEAQALPYRPLISVVMPTYNTPEKWLVKAIESIRRQFYTHWELCIADDASPKPEVRRVLERYAALDPRIKVCFRETNGHISAASNSALELAEGEFIALLDHDDELPPHALHAVAAELNAHRDADLIYSDEDKIDEEGRRFGPYFKPAWNPDLLTGQNCVSHLGVYRAALLREVGGFRVGFEGCQDWDLALRVAERIAPERIRHIPRVLYHWRAIAGSTARAADEKDYIREAALRVLREHCQRTSARAEVMTLSGGASHCRLRYLLPDPPPLVSIVIPTRNQGRLLRQCIESIVERSTYPSYEILIVDNGSDESETLDYLSDLDRQPRVRVLPYDKPFNYSAINNFAVSEARGEVVCLLNNDTEIITPGWLEEMVGHALRPEIGAVGALLLYPDDAIQHAGVVLGLGGIAGHVFCRQPRGSEGYFNRARLAQNFSAVTAACLVVRKALYEEVGGLEEKRLTVAFNDVDFCLRLLETGRRNLWTPFAELYHHESVSRGAEDTPAKHSRFVGEVEYMAERWAEMVASDPAYNPNLTVEHGDCRRACPPRVPPLAASPL